MEKLYELKERLIKELGDYAGREINSSTLDIMMRASKTLKNVCYVLAQREGEENGQSYGPDPMGRDVEPGRDMSFRGNSYGRGRRNASRDAMGRYSGYSGYSGYSTHQDPARDLRELMQHAPDEQTRRELEEIARRMER